MLSFLNHTEISISLMNKKNKLRTQKEKDNSIGKQNKFEINKKKTLLQFSKRINCLFWFNFSTFRQNLAAYIRKPKKWFKQSLKKNSLLHFNSFFMFVLLVCTCFFFLTCLWNSNSFLLLCLIKSLTSYAHS